MVSSESFDVVIVGAGISGINTAYYLQNRGPKNLSYTILEGRGELGGTWSLFQYPGIRSDSDIFTFGFSWNPWEGSEPITSGDKICTYLRSSVAKTGIDKHIRYNQHVWSAEWSSASSTWTIQARKGDKADIVYRTRFLVLGTGYYDYDQPLPTVIPGLESFKGPVIRPQFWPRDLNYVNKNVVIIGSGATAITLLPNMAEDAKHVTMLQRSPTYIFPLASRQNLLLRSLRSILPSVMARYIDRLRFIFLQILMYNVCRWFPGFGRRLISFEARKHLPSGYNLDPDFNPRYKPWDQRLCITPDGDFFAAIRSTKADVVTDHIKTVTEDSIELVSGKVLRPDIIIAATGIKLSFAGKIKLVVDGEPIDISKKFLLKGSMIQDVPNMAVVVGYAMASWTLAAEATGVFLSRLWSATSRKGLKSVTPRCNESNMKALPPLDLNSTYVQAGKDSMPKSGQGIWAPRENYYKDISVATWGNLWECLEVK